MLKIYVGPGLGVKTASSNLSILLRILTWPRLALQDPKLGAPVGECQTQSRDIGIPREQFRFDRGDLAETPLDFLSYCSSAFLGNFIEHSAIAVQDSLSAAERLPALHDHVAIFGIKFNPVTDALRQFRGR